MEDNNDFQRTKWGDFILVLDYPDKHDRFQTVEIKTRTEQYFQRFRRDRQILFEIMGNVQRVKSGSSFLECKADLYAYGFVNGAMDYILDAFIFRVQETKQWLQNNLHRYPTLKSSTDSKYNTDFKLVPMDDIPAYCIVSATAKNIDLNELFWDPKPTVD